MVNKIRVADYIVKRCVDAGICDAFLVTGGGAMHLNDAIFREKKITPHFFHHEQAASIAAEGYARVVGRPVLLNVTTGPGGINALNGVHGAYVDSVPIFVVSGQVKKSTIASTVTKNLRQLGDQEANILEMVRGITKYSRLILNGFEISEAISKALFLMNHGRPGPVWLDVPIDVQSLEMPPTCEVSNQSSLLDPEFFLKDACIPENSKDEFRVFAQDNIDKGIDDLIERLRQSKRPLFLVGNGIHHSLSKEILLKVLDETKIPIVTAWNAHDLIPVNHPGYLGRPGTVGDRSGNFAVQNADLLIILGCRLNIRQVSYNWSTFAKNAWISMIDADINELLKPTLKIDNPIRADLKIFLNKFLMRVKTNNFDNRILWSRFTDKSKVTQAKHPVLVEKMSLGVDINPYLFIDKLFSKIGNDVNVVCGNGSACVITFQVAKNKQGQRIFTNSGSASMGYDLPASIGAAIADKSRQTICIAGDGSLMMNIQELQTLASKNLNVKVIVLNNNGYASIKQTQNNYFPDMVCGVSPETGVGLPDFVKVAKAFSIEARRLTSKRSIGASLKWLLEGASPKLLEVVVDEDQIFEPKLVSKKLPDGTMESPELDDMFPFLGLDILREARKF